MELAQPILAGCAAIATLTVILYCAYVWYKGIRPKFELHGYQIDFLDEFARARGLKGAASALQAIVDEASGSETVRAAIFDSFHCVHCGSVSPAEWISSRKGKKEAYALAVTKDAVAFLSKEHLVPVEKRGEPPKRQIVEGPRRADVNKAARCCVDWAIKQYGASADGTIKMGAAKARSKSPKKQQ